MAGASDIRAGRSFVEIYGDKTKLTRTLKSISGDLKAFGAGVSAMGKKFMLLGAGMIAPLLAATKHFMTVGDQLDKMSARTGLSTNALSELGFAAEQSGTNIETLEKGIRTMQRSILDAGRGLSTQVDALEGLGLEYKDLAGLSPEKQFELMAEHLERIEDPSKKAGLAMMLFGRAGTAMIPMLKDMKALREEAQKLGLSIGPEQAKAAAALTDAWNRAKRSFGAVAVAIGTELAPLLTSLAEDIKILIADFGKWIGKHGDLILTTLRLGVAVVALGAAMKVLGVALVFIAANPVVAGFIALGVAVVYLKGGFEGLLKTTEKYVDVAGKTLAKGDQQRRQVNDLLGELKSLSEQQSLTADEQQRAKDIIAALTAAYGDLGLSIDETTGKITGMAGAQAKANAKMREAALLELAGAEAAAKGELERSRKRQAELFAPGHKGFWGFAIGGYAGKSAEESEKQIALQEKLRSIGRQQELWQAGDIAGALGEKPPGGVAGSDKALSGVEELKKQERELHRLQLQGIQDEYDRKIALIDEEYDHRIAEAEKAGQETYNLEAMRNEKIAQAFDEAAKKKAEEEKRSAEESARLDDEKAANRQRLNDDIARAKIEATLTGHDKTMALLDLERKQALRDIALGADENKIKELYDLRAAALGIDLPAAVGPKTTTRGTFSASAAAGMGTGQTMVGLTKELKVLLGHANKLNDKQLNRLHDLIGALEAAP